MLKYYWKCYGGFKALFTSKFLWLSILIAILLWPRWSQPDWWDDVLSIMPNLLGFSLGGFAMWIAIGDDDFRSLIAGEDESDGDDSVSPYMEVNAAFVHFIILQLCSIVFALFAKTYFFKLSPDFQFFDTIKSVLPYIVLPGYFISYTLFIYAIFSGLASTFALLRVSKWYDLHQTNKKIKSNKTVKYSVKFKNNHMRKKT